MGAAQPEILAGRARGVRLADHRERITRLDQLEIARQLWVTPSARTELLDFIGANLVPVAARPTDDCVVLYVDHDLLETLFELVGWNLPDDIDEWVRERCGLDVQPDMSAPLTRRLFADRYGGVGLFGNKGAGRAVIDPELGLYITGIGATPLAHAAPSTFEGYHGRLKVTNAVRRMACSMVLENLVEVPGTRVLAVLIRPSTLGLQGNAVHGWMVRAAIQPRLGHLMETETAARADAAAVLDHCLERSARGSERRRRLAEILGIHATAQAQWTRWRMHHGAQAASNILVGGGPVDLDSTTSQPGTAPIMVDDYTAIYGTSSAVDQYGLEHMARTLEWVTSLKSISELPGADPAWQDDALWARYELPRLYDDAFALELVRALGVPEPFVAAVRERCPEAMRQLAQSWTTLSRLIRPGKRWLLPLPRELSVVDIHAALGALPRWVLVDALSPDELDTRTREALGFRVDGLPETYVERLRHTVRAHSRALARAASTVLSAVMTAGSQRPGDGSDLASLIAQRARFMNEPLTALERDTFSATIEEHTTSDLDATHRDLRRILLSAVGRSRRCVGGLLRQGRHLREASDLVLQRRTVDGWTYRVRCSGQRSVLEISGYLDAANGPVELFLNPRLFAGIDRFATFEAEVVRGEVTFVVPIQTGFAVVVEGTIRRGTQILARLDGYSCVSPYETELEQISACLPDTLDAAVSVEMSPAASHGFFSRYGGAMQDTSLFTPAIGDYLAAEMVFVEQVMRERGLNHLLEIGSGPGRYRQWANERGLHYDGIDFVRDLVHKAEPYGGGPLRSHVHYASADDLDRLFEREALHAADYKTLVLFPFNCFGNIAKNAKVIRHLATLELTAVVSTYQLTEDATNERMR